MEDKNNKQNNQPNRIRSIGTIAVWVLILGLMVFMVTNGCSPQKAKEINFDEFATAYKADKIKAVYEVLEGGTFYGMYRTNTADATKLPSGADFVIYLSNESFHENNHRRNGGDFVDSSESISSCRRQDFVRRTPDFAYI